MLLRTIDRNLDERATRYGKAVAAAHAKNNNRARDPTPKRGVEGFRREADAGQREIDNRGDKMSYLAKGITKVAKVCNLDM